MFIQVVPVLVPVSATRALAAQWTLANRFLHSASFTRTSAVTRS